MIEHEVQHSSLPELPKDWLPDGSAISAIGKHHLDDEVWEFAFPEYAIVGRGQTQRHAIRQALELLDDYFRLCAAEGIRFEDARRPMPTGWLVREYGALAVDQMMRRLRRTSARVRFLRVPADPLLN